MKAILRFLLLISMCVSCALALTMGTYLYSYEKDIVSWAVWSVNRGLPFPWAVEMHYHVFEPSESSPYPFTFQALNFSLDWIFWSAIFLFSTSLYLYRANIQARIGNFNLKRER